MAIAFMKYTARKVLGRARKIILSPSFPSAIQFPVFRLVYYRHGVSLCKKLRKEYGTDAALCVCPYKGTGDVYLAAAFFKGGADDTAKSLFCVIGKSNEKIARLFRLNAKVLQFSQKQIDSLTRLAFFIGLEKANVRILHHDPNNWHGGINDRLRNINGLMFTDLIGYGAFRVENPQKLSKPVFLDRDSEVESMFGEHGLKKEKTVLLAPFSYTLEVLPEWFWKKLAIGLKGMGYSVCTNLGSKEEKAIAGSEGVFLRYDQLGVFLRNAGTFIGIRSGLCDVVSSIPCRKIILYQPYLFWGEGGNMDYFSLNKMGLCTDAIELQHEREDFISLLNDIRSLV